MKSKRRPAAKGRTQKPRRAPTAARAPRVARRATARDLEAVRKAVATAARQGTARWNADPEDVRRSVLKLVLTLVELIRQLLERQAIRRMEARTLDPDEIERVGLALMRLQETVIDLANEFDIAPEELNLDLGPVGKLL